MAKKTSKSECLALVKSGRARKFTAKGKVVCIKVKPKSKFKTHSFKGMTCKNTKNGHKVCNTGKGVTGWTFVS
jgi:hypothetical protein